MKLPKAVAETVAKRARRAFQTTYATIVIARQHMRAQAFVSNGDAAADFAHRSPFNTLATTRIASERRPSLLQFVVSIEQLYQFANGTSLFKVFSKTVITDQMLVRNARFVVLRFWLNEHCF
jgi:hypothetical protein